MLIESPSADKQRAGTPLPDLPLIVEPAELAPLLGHPQLILADLCRLDNYDIAHLPNAVYIHPGETQLGIPPAPGFLPPIERLQQLVDRLGLTADSWVVVYDDEGGGWAGRMIWLLDCIGFKRYSYLNGGLIAWHQEGRPLTTEPPTPKTPANWTLQPDANPTATLDYVRSRLASSDLAIWDARSAEEYTGGHIPGAVNLEWTQAMDPSRAYRLKPDAQLKLMLDRIGVTPDKEVITHCQTHHRSGLTYLIAKHLGFPRVKAYAGSWSEWGNHPETPIE
jgi:thiosulfate/3-mercaptopyruvate sulfurtransferase